MKDINYAIISSSTRKNSQSRKVADFIANGLLKSTKEELIQVIDFAIDNFPLWDEAIWSQGIAWHVDWKRVSEKLQKSDAIIIVSPEWNGMVPPQLINFFQLCSNQELSHKPGLIVSISSGIGGSYPIAELRMSSYKNTKICYIPEHIIVRDVNNVLNDYTSIADNGDQYIRDRIHHVLSLLYLYADAFKKIRDHEIITNSQYKYGM